MAESNKKNETDTKAHDIIMKNESATKPHGSVEKNETVTEEQRLEWYKTIEEIDKIPTGSGVREKMASKIKQNPLVPIGMIATTIALSLGLNAMRTGNKRKSQKMMRARIYAQGFTIAAILGGIVVAARTKPSNTKA